MTTIVHRRIITEARKPGEVFKKLSNPAKQLALLMADLYDRHGKKTFTFDDIRQFTSAYGSWRDILQLFYELESRRMGKIQQHDAITRFHAFIPAMQNLNEGDL